MKKLSLLSTALVCAVTALAQAPSNVPSGYYRVHNYGTDRYIHVTDNKGSLEVSTATVDMNAIRLYKGREGAISDPASVLKVTKVGSVYDITAQSTGIYQMISTYLNLMDSPKHPGCYYAYGKKASTVMYLYDAKSNPSAYESWLSTSGSEDQRNWYITPIDTNTDNYFGVKPTVQSGGKYYQPFYADFPFSFANSGMKAYYVTRVDEVSGYAIYKEITGTVPASTPVFIECSSDQPINNKLNIGGTGTQVNDNGLVGVYFESTLYKHENFVTYDPSTMRSLGVLSDGSLGLVKGNYEMVPRNTFYMPVSKNCPATLRLVTEAEYEELKDPVPATGITLSSNNLSIVIGQSATLSATIQPADATERNISWSTSNSAIASVDQSGKITAVGIGTATIKATVGSVSATCQVTVTPVMATSVTLSVTSLNLKVGETGQISATVAPDNASDKTVNWTSSNSSVATVDATGKVTAMAPGTATITAKCGNVSATCQVTVTAIEVTAVTLNKTSLDMIVGDTETLTATVAPENATYKTVTWKSSNTAVATVSSTGKVTAVGAGSATITATSGSVSATCQVTVRIIEVESVTLNKTSLDLKVGATESLTATVNPSNATYKTVTWSSSDATVASVNANGVVTANKAGNAVITAACGDIKAQCQVTVSVVEAESVTLNHTSLDLTIGQTQTLVATVAPSNTTDKSLTWTSSNTAVATVNSNGMVTAVAIGQADITVKCGNVTATCKVTVNPVLASSVTLNYTSLNLLLGQTETLRATVSPSNTTDKTVTWTSSDQTVATVDASGKVTAVSVGNAVITATCGNVSATCQVTVDPILASDVTLDITSTTVYAGETVQLTATVSPENTTDPTITWTSSRLTVARVDASGKVTAIAPGTAIITAKCGNASAKCTITVLNPNAEQIILSQTNVTLLLGESISITAEVLPESAIDKTVTWTSSDESVATVSADGKIEAVGVGNAVITAQCGDVTATCAVTVNPILATGIALNKTSVQLLIGASETLVATVSPANTTDKTLTWASSDNDVVTVDQDGKVTAVALGEAVITVTCGDVSATCNVTVTPVEPTSITINKTQIDLTIGESETLVATIEPEDTTDKTIQWTSSDESVATVDADGKVTAVAVGQATITATSADVSASCLVNVLPIEAESVTLDQTNVELLIGATYRLEATVNPDNTTDKTIVWTTSDADVVSVDQDGNLNALSLGSAIITATCGKVSATCKVTVSPILAEQVILDKTEISIIEDETVALTATVVPDETTDKTVVWSSSDTSVATVDADGNVTGVSVGTAQIIASCGAIYAVCDVTVTAKDGIIDVIVDADGAYDVYTVQGIKVRSGVTSLKGLPKGVYIVNGNKYYVR